MTRRRSRRMHPAVILLGTVVLLAADAAAWLLWFAWHLLALPLAAGGLFGGGR
jgi:hypothetical protein